MWDPPLSFLIKKIYKFNFFSLWALQITHTLDYSPQKFPASARNVPQGVRHSLIIHIIFIIHCEPLLFAGIFCIKEEKQSNYILTHVPPYSDAAHIMGLYEILPRRPWNIYRFDKFVCSHNYVHLLPVGRMRSKIPEISVVEKVHHDASVGELFIFLKKGYPELITGVDWPRKLSGNFLGGGVWFIRFGPVYLEVLGRYSGCKGKMRKIWHDGRIMKVKSWPDTIAFSQ